MAVDSNGDVYVADQGYNAIKEIVAVDGSVSLSSPVATLHTFTGTAGPTGVALDASGNVYVADQGSNSVYEIMAVNGSIPASPTITTLGGGFDYPTGVAVDGNGNVYVADAENNRVVEMTLPASNQNFGSINIGTTSPANTLSFVFDTGGTLGSTAVLTQGATALDFANAGTGSCVAGTAYTADESCTINVTFTPRFAGIRTGTAVLYDTNGNAIASGYVQGTGVGPQIAFQPGVLSTVSSVSSGPFGVAVDGSGDLYVTADENNGVEEILAVNGSIPASPTIISLGTGFNEPAGLAIDGSGNVYVADSRNNEVKEILAVNGSIPASPTIVTLGSGFSAPNGVAVDRAGNVFVADTGNGAIKEILAVNGSIPASPTILTLETGVSAVFIAIDGSGNVYATVGDGPVFEILAVSGSIPPSPTVKLISSSLNELAGLAVDGSGNIYVANNQNALSEIHAVNGSIPSSPVITTLSSGFYFATCLVLDSRGNIYVADLGNNRVAKLDFADAPSLTFAATPVGSTSADSPRTVTVQNIGNAALTFPIPSTGNNPSIAGNFTLNSSGASACPLLSSGSSKAGTLAVGASCQLPISFSPTAAGILSGSLVLTDNNLNAAAPGYTTQNISRNGTGSQFTISAPATVNLIQGATSTSPISVIPVGGFTGSVQLFLSSLFGVPTNTPPPGITASFSPNPTTGTSVLTLTASSTAVAQRYVLSVTGTSGSLIEATTIILTVSPAPSFTLSASPPFQGMAPGGYSTSTIAVTDLNGFTGSVNLAASELPSGVTASFAPNSTAGTSVLTLTASSAATLGTANLVITGISGTLTEVTTLALTVNPVVVTAPSLSNFGTVNIGATSPAIPVVFTFVNGGTLGSTAVLTQGATGLDFADAGSDTCTPNTAYTAGQTCTVNVTFTPTFAGVRYGAVVLDDINGNVLATAYLQGAGIGPQINFLPNTESTVASASNGLNFPYGVAVDGSGSVYIADIANNVIWKEAYSAGGYTQSVLPTSSLYTPLGVAVDGSGNVYIADANNFRVLKETPSMGGYIESVVTNSAGQDTISPLSVAVDGNGNVYFIAFDIDNGDENLYEEKPFTGSYSQSTIPYSGVSDPTGIAVDGSGNIYISDRGNNQIIEETPSNGGFTQSTVPTSGLNQPLGVAVDGIGNLYIADSPNERVVKETLDGATYIQSTLSTSPLNDPLVVAVDGSGNVYIGDAGNSRVLKEDFADAPSLTFASAAVGSISPDSPQTVTVENVGNAALTFPAASTGNNPSIGADFTLNSSGASACPLVSAGSSTGGTLAAGASCLLPISFTPTAASALSGSLVLTDNNLNAAAPGYAVQTIALSGTGTQATPTITWATPSAITYGTPLSAIQLNATASVAGTFTYSPAVGTVLNAGTQTLTVTFTPTDTTDYTTATASVTLTVNQAPLTINWATPPAISYGTALSATQLDASSTANGTFVYLPAAGTVLGVGNHTLTVTLTPAIPANYTTTTATARVTLTVNKATPVIMWATPAAITYGTALSATQLNASSTIAGSFIYSPAAGSVLTAGAHMLSVTFVPFNPIDYTTATTTVTLIVNKATPTIAWTTPAAITFGTALSATQLNAKASVPGGLVYSPVAGTIPAVGTDPLTVNFTPSDTTDYTMAMDSVLLKVNPAPSFTLSASPASLTVAQGASGKSTITVSGQNGFTGSVTLATSGLPSGVTAAFAPNPTTGTSVLTLTASSTAATGNVTVTIKGTSGTLTASTNIALTISCTPTTIVPFISVNGGSTWTQESSATVNSPSTAVDLGPQPSTGGTWSWIGPSGYTSTSRQINSIPLTVGADSYVATYTNVSGCKSTETFTITVK